MFGIPSVCFAYLIFIAKNIWCQLRLHTFVYLPSHIHLYMMNINVLAHSLIFSKIKISHFRFSLSIRYHCYFWSLVSTGFSWIANSNNVYPLHKVVGIYHYMNHYVKIFWLNYKNEISLEYSIWNMDSFVLSLLIKCINILYE